MTLHILIAEPNRKNQELLREPLSAQGFEIIQSADSDETWRLIQSQKPDLVLLQVGAAVSDSEEIVRRIRVDRELAQTSIFCLGEKVTSDELVKWFNLGVDNYIDDSFSVQLLVAQIKAHLRRNGPQNPPRSSSGIPFKRRVL